MTAVQLGRVLDLKTGTYGTFTAELYLWRLIMRDSHTAEVHVSLQTSGSSA